MIFCISFYLKHGLKNPPHINLNERRLITEVGLELMEFLDEKFLVSKKHHKKEINLFSKPLSNKTKEGFYLELSVLLKAGVDLKSSLELIEKSIKKRQTKAIVNQIYEAIISGKSLSEAIEEIKHFTHYEYHSLRIGEETGTLAEVTTQLGEFFNKKNEQKRLIVSALTYPLIIMCTAVLVVAFMLNFVVPMFEDMFRQQQIELPAITVFIIDMSNFFKSYGWLMFMIVLVIIASQTFLRKQPKYKKLRDRLILKTPIIGSFTKTVYVSQFSQAIALLTASKVPMVSSIQLVKKMIQFYPLQNALESIEYDLLLGKSLSDSLKKHSFFDDKMSALVKVAEETNQTSFIFEKLSQQYSSQVQQKSKTLTTFLEPFIIFFVGIMVGIILIAMYLPMFKLSSVIG